jgi:hypothetical protein
MSETSSRRGFLGASAPRFRRWPTRGWPPPRAPAKPADLPGLTIKEVRA